MRSFTLVPYLQYIQKFEWNTRKYIQKQTLQQLITQCHEVSARPATTLCSK